MLETYRFVGMLATMQPPYHMVPEVPSPEKVVTILSTNLFSSTDVKNVSIKAHLHTPSQFTGLLGKRLLFIRSYIYNYFTT